MSDTVRERPQVATRWVVRAGSRDDLPGSTGLAHYLEHMMFAGTNDPKTNGTKGIRVDHHTMKWTASSANSGCEVDDRDRLDEAGALLARLDGVAIEAFGGPIESVRADILADRHFTADEAREYGLIDGIDP